MQCMNCHQETNDFVLCTSDNDQLNVLCRDCLTSSTLDNTLTTETQFFDLTALTDTPSTIKYCCD